MSHAKLCEAAKTLLKVIATNFPIEGYGVPPGGSKVLPITIHTLEVALRDVVRLLPKRTGSIQITGSKAHAEFDATEKLTYACNGIRVWLRGGDASFKKIAIHKVGPIDPDLLRMLDCAILTLNKDEPTADTAGIGVVTKEPPLDGTVIFSATEAARYVGATPKTMRSWIKDCLISAEDVGNKRYRFTLRELNAKKQAKADRKAEKR